MQIDKRLLSFLPISVKLGFDWDRTTSEERAQLRYDYIQKCLDKDPNYVGWDFPECISWVHPNDKSKPVYSVDFTKLVNTLGSFIIPRKEKLYSTPGGDNVTGYKLIGLYISGKWKKVSVHRVIGTTFIPVPGYLADQRKSLVINHKNDKRFCNFMSNLEWCTGDENGLKAQETGVKPTLSLKYTITDLRNLKGKEYYIVGKKLLDKLGFAWPAIYKSFHTGCKAYHGTWETVPREESENKRIGIPENDLKIIFDKTNSFTDVLATVGTIMTDGPCKGEQFVLFGGNQIKINGFNPSKVCDVIKGNRILSGGCSWKRISRDEAGDIPCFNERHKGHLFGQ